MGKREKGGRKERQERGREGRVQTGPD